MEGTARSFSDDAMLIAQAFRGASDEDILEALNVMAKTNVPNSIYSLKFYLVPSTWMRKVLPILNARDTATIAAIIGGVEDTIATESDWREHVGMIDNSHLLESDNAVSSDSDHDGVEDMKQSVRLQQQHIKANSPLRSELVHGRDFLLLGPSAWLLVREKFGLDGIELGRACVFDESSETKVSVDLNAHQPPGKTLPLIPLPPNGRFDYKKLLDTSSPHDSLIVCQSLRPSQERTTSTDVVSEDDHVSAMNDLFPDDDDAGKTSEPVLLLPPSTISIGGPSEVTTATDDNDTNEIMGGKLSGTSTKATNGATHDIISTQLPVFRKYGSGLGNLGNTCFMNSTLQCLAHTYPLRRYFLSGEYEKDLNKENPLGTGGDLAIQFAMLLDEMWGTSGGRSNRLIASRDAEVSPVVYPRNFKLTLGKHAEQFMGYDQHDSQELATYLLDALHEDTNRVTKKPYIEKPEQGKDEADEVAAGKAWELHLKREDSRVLEHFMGQIKSRVQCSEVSCGRVSTTFDPFMYLSVPIPGSDERTLRVTYVPLNPDDKPKNVQLTLNKTSSMAKLISVLIEKLTKLNVIEKNSVKAEDLSPVDVWQNEVHQWYDNNEDIDKIREADETFVFQLTSSEEIRKIDQEGGDDEDDRNIALSLKQYQLRRRYKLDFASLVKINRDEEWQTSLEQYVRQSKLLYAMLNPKRASISERVEFFHKLVGFIDQCISDLDFDKAGNKRAREDTPLQDVSTDEDPIPDLEERSKESQTFTNVKNTFDLAVLELCAAKLQKFILDLVDDDNKDSDGYVIQILLRKSYSGGSGSSYSGTKDKGFVAPLLLRIPATMTVYQLREELAQRFIRSLKTGKADVNEGEESAEPQGSDSDVVPMDEYVMIEGESSADTGDPALLIMRQIPLSFKRKSTFHKSSYASHKKLGSLESWTSYDSPRPISLASPTDVDEQACVAEFVGSKGTVFLDWPEELCERALDETEYTAVDEVSDPEETESKLQRANKTTTVLDCVEKYCQMEQLEETEMWYCNRCKKHVRAWKQFHIYRAPQILIVQLKRFHYSASNHRREKISDFIDFPLHGLDLTEQVLHRTSDDEKPIYDCYAVSNHYGHLGGGHYTAYALNDDGVWCHYDDSRVTNNIDPKEVVSEAAYVLYYRRRDVVVKTDFLEDFEVVSSPAIVQDDFEIGMEQNDVSTGTIPRGGQEDMDVDDTEVPSMGSTCASNLGSMDGVYDENNEEYDDEKNTDTFLYNAVEDDDVWGTR